MKHFFITLICFFLAVPLYTHAQEKEDYSYIEYSKNEFYIQYGTPSIVELTGKFDNNTYARPEKTYKYEGYGYRYTGVGALGYNRYLNPFVYLGAYLGLSESSAKIKDQESGKLVYSNHIKNYTGLLSIGWTYYKSGIWDISCGASAGACFKDETQKDIDAQNHFIPNEKDKLTFAYNLTALKVRLGGGTIGGFMELGFGYKGLINAGLSIKF